MMRKMGKAFAAGACVLAAVHTVGVEATNSTNATAACTTAMDAIGTEANCKPTKSGTTYTKATKTCEAACKNKVKAAVTACTGTANAAHKTDADGYTALCASTNSGAMQRLETWVGTAVAFGLALAAF